MSEADEMFEKLGYKKKYLSNNVERYIDKYDYNIDFNHDFKAIGCDNPITMEELQAIYKKSEELGWI